MSTYIFITSKVGGIGGAQIYLNNKIEYLHSKGWFPIVIYTNNDDLDRLIVNREGAFLFVPSLRYHPSSYSKRGQKAIISKVLTQLDKIANIRKEGVVVESHFINQALWGDLISFSLKSRHLIYLLSDKSLLINQSDLRYLKYKLLNNSLAIINERLFPKIFPKYEGNIDPKSVVLKAGLIYSAIKNVPHKEIDRINREEINIGCIARLDKPFVGRVLDEVIEFTRYFSAKKILFLLIGSASDSRLETEIKKKASQVENLRLELVPSTYPVPTRVLEIIDVFVSSSGSATACAFNGALTLAVDVKSANPIGLLGIDTHNSLSHSGESKYTSVSATLIDIFSDTKSPADYKPEIKLIIDTKENNYRKHITFLDNIGKNYFYEGLAQFRLKYFVSRNVPFIKKKLNTFK